MERPLVSGSVVYIRYRDHVLFNEVDASQQRPWIRECLGWLDYEDDEYVRIVWERYAMPDPPNESKPKATGLVILRRAIIEERRIG
jgi:hypothetical protein